MVITKLTAKLPAVESLWKRAPRCKQSRVDVSEASRPSGTRSRDLASNGHDLLTVSRECVAQRWQVSLPKLGLCEWLPGLAEVLTELKFKDGNPPSVLPPECLRRFGLRFVSPLDIATARGDESAQQLERCLRR